MKKLGRRTFIEKAGMGLAMGSAPLAAGAKGAVFAKEKNELPGKSRSRGPERQGVQHCVVEWEYASGKAYADPFNEVELDVVFTDPEGREQRVPAFWAGDEVWRVRYSPSSPGKRSSMMARRIRSSRQLTSSAGSLIRRSRPTWKTKGETSIWPLPEPVLPRRRS